jgi:hypothetical protein
VERDLELLRGEFLAPLHASIDAARARGHELRPFCTRRDPWTQARLWRQSRSREEVHSAIEFLRSHGAPHLSGVLESVGPQGGRWATNALPGLSWHQWSEACDLFLVDQGGTAIWSPDHPGYVALHEEARARGLHVPLPRRDAYHVQLRIGSVLHEHSWPGIDQAMMEEYGGEEA